MAMQTIYFKEHEGLVPNSGSPSSTSIGQIASGPSGPWWSNFGTQSSFGESFAHLKPFSALEPHQNSGGGGHQFLAAKQAGIRGTEFGLEKGNNHFNSFPGDGKFSGDGLKSQGISLPEYNARFELGFGQPMVCTKYPYGDQYCGVFSYGHQISGRIMLPLNLTTDDGPIYVNAKQYHGIIRRRRSRAKAAVLMNKIPKPRKLYMHESRHLHAMRRPRGCGGRFLNTKNLKEAKADANSNPSSGSSQSSEILRSDAGTLNSPKEGAGNNGLNNSNMSGLEVTSTCSRADHLGQFMRGQPVHVLTRMSMMDCVIPGGPNGIGAADRGYINLKA